MSAATYDVRLPLAGRRVVVVGGGTMALRRVTGLLAVEAEVTVVAPELTATLSDLETRAAITVVRRPYAPGDLGGAWLALACTGVPEVDVEVAAEAEAARVWCLPAGESAMREWAVHEPTRREAPDSKPSAHDPVERAGGPARAPSAGQTGDVVLVGGGPGDPGLLTVRGRERLLAADVVVVDRLAPLAVLDELPGHVRVVDAAKVPRGPAAGQNRINDLLIEHARAGRTVVRLKGGDPYVLGRGLEEAQVCAEAGVVVEVVPGVSSALAAPAVAGIPLTHRGVTQGFTVLSGHVPPGDPRGTVNWAAAARSGTTLVLLMAVDNLAAITAALVAGGLAAETPSACVVEGGLPGQRVVTALVGELAVAAERAGVHNPAVVVIGEVARFAAAADGGTGGASADGATGEQPARAAPNAPSPSDFAKQILVLGGSRSGKSATAERTLATAAEVVYVATGAPADGSDSEWAERVRRHQRRRPANWTTVETRDLAGLLDADGPPVLVDCLSTWLAGVMDEYDVWGQAAGADAALAKRIDELAEAWASSDRPIVAVSSEVGSGVVPASASGRRFRDELGALNARIATAADEVWQCVAGVPRRLR